MKLLKIRHTHAYTHKEKKCEDEEEKPIINIKFNNKKDDEEEGKFYIEKTTFKK